MDPPEGASAKVRRRYQQHNFEVRKKRRMARAGLQVTAGFPERMVGTTFLKGNKQGLRDEGLKKGLDE